MCRAGWYYLLIVGLVLTGALLRDVNLLLLLAAMLIGPLLLSRSLARMTLRGMSAVRKLPDGICAGDLLVAKVLLTNGRRHLGAWAIVAEDSLVRLRGDEELRAANGTARRRRGRAATPNGDREGDTPQVFFPYLPSGQTRKGNYHGRLTERGRYRAGPLRISTSFPFGLFQHTVVLPTVEELVVLPRLGRLTSLWNARHREAFAGTDQRERRAGVEGDFYGVRPWRAGDSRRWIHWRTAARTGALAVRQFEQPRNRDIVILLDLGSADASPAARDNVELAVSFVATVIAESCRKGGSDLYLGTTYTDGPGFHGGPASAALLQNMLERLALVEPPRGDSLPALLAELSGNVDPGTEMILVSTRPVDLHDAARFGASLADAAGRSLSRHVRVIDASAAELARYFQPQ
jgi:uncharacterized protein (DUF58 family)